MPRPKKLCDERRPHVVSFRLTAGECAHLQGEAAAAGLSANEYARLKATACGAPVVAPAAQAEARGMSELRLELRRVGVNLNQIARRLNMIGEHDPAELRDAARHLDEIFIRMIERGLP